MVAAMVRSKNEQWSTAVLTANLTAARELVLPALYRQAVRGLPVLADKGYTGAGAGILVPYKNRPEGPLHLDNRCYNELITALRAPAERANALLGRWRALDRVTICPQRISAIAAALVLTSLDRGTR
jgi:DDE superfamily endonuclease